MSRKRRNTSSPESDSPVPIKRRSISFDEANDSESSQSDQYPTNNEKAKIDLFYGQRSAFPGLDEAEDLFYGPANNGIEYLRMVRSEAQTVPHILSVNTVSENPDNQVEWEEDGGFYEDEAYIAPIQELKKVENGHPNAQEAYYNALRIRFSSLQLTLKDVPPLAAIEFLTSSQPISFPSRSKKAEQQWQDILASKNPNPVQLCCMDGESCMSMVRLLTKSMAATLRGGNIDDVERFGVWSWAILGRSRDRGELTSEEIADLREFGKRAVSMIEGIRAKKKRFGHPENTEGIDDTTEELRNEDEGNHIGSGYSGLTAGFDQNPRPQGEIGDARNSPNTDTQMGANPASTMEENDIKLEAERRIRMVLDMIITVIGEFYGQRDLLDSRSTWKLI